MPTLTDPLCANTHRQLRTKPHRCRQRKVPRKHTRAFHKILVTSLKKPQRQLSMLTHPLYSTKSFSDPPPTDPTSIAILWQQVMAPLKPSHGQKPTSPLSTVATSRTRSGKTLSSDTTNTPSVNPSVKDTDFREKVLRPRGIVITHRGRLQGQSVVLDTPYTYFQTLRPPPGVSSADHYNGDHGSPWSPITSKVWLDLDLSCVDKIAQEYQIMNDRRLCEEEFASYAKETLLKRDHRDLNPDTRFWTVDRMVKPTLKPEGLLEVLPILEDEANTASFRFHLLPDCMYWISLHGFNADYRSAISGLTYVIDDSEVACPYLTVEFKKDGASKVQAQNQIVAPSALILYSRYQLRLNCLRAQNAPIDQNSAKDVMHFGLTFCGTICEIFICQPTLTETGEWNGCTMSLVGSYNCRRSREVRFVMEWLNEIHFWGMQVHGKGCEDDLKGYLRATVAHTARVSDIAREQR